MKLLLFTLLSFCGLFSNAQLLDLTSNWFGEEGFFVEKTLQDHNIKSITIEKSSKLDGKYFSSEQDALKYTFNTSGQLVQSLKFIPLADRTDSSVFTFFYNKTQKVFKREEKEGPFSFTYYFVYKDDKLQKEVKINNYSPNLDTSYIRFYAHEELDGNTEKVTYFNSIRRPYQYREDQFDLFGQLIHQKTSLVRSQNFSEKEFTYQVNQLIKKRSFTNVGKQQVNIWEYSYEKGILDFIKHFQDDALIEKIGFTYRQDGLVSAIVTRDMERKSVTIYKFSYTFFD